MSIQFPPDSTKIALEEVVWQKDEGEEKAKGKGKGKGRKGEGEGEREKGEGEGKGKGGRKGGRNLPASWE